MDNTEKSIRKTEEVLEQLSLERLMDSLQPDEIQENSLIAQRLLNFPDVDPAFRRFAQTLGAWEIGIGEIMGQIQGDVSDSLQLLQVLTNTENKIQLMEFSARLKKVERKIPSIVREIAAGMFGASLAQPQGGMIPGLPFASQPSPFPPPSVDPDYVSYEWTDAAKLPSGPAPVVRGGVKVIGGKAQLAGPSDNAIGVAVSVNNTDKLVSVAVNGDKLAGLGASDLVGLNAGDELIPSLVEVSGRYLMTIAEASAQGIIAGTPIKIIARVIRNDTNGRSIVVLDQPLRPMPV